MRFLSLFSGIGGIDLGLERAGMTCIGQVEIDPFCRRVLAKHWPGVWQHGDVKTVTRALVEESCGLPDLICGGFPCQDISNAGKRVGINGERSGLWSEYFRIICELRPRYVFVENVSALLARGLGRVLGDLSCIGFDAEWSVVPACAFGAPHSRERLFLFANRVQIGWDSEGRDCSTSGSIRSRSPWQAAPDISEWRNLECWLGQAVQDRNFNEAAGAVCGMDDGISKRLDRIGGLGNAVVPQVAEFIGRRIMAAVGGVA